MASFSAVSYNLNFDMLVSKNNNVLPEGIGKGYVNAEIALCPVCAVHAEPQSSRIATTCCKCKDCKKLWKDNDSPKWIQHLYIVMTTEATVTLRGGSGQVLNGSKRKLFSVIHWLFLISLKWQARMWNSNKNWLRLARGKNCPQSCTLINSL